jgi:outer membrane protein assembly factor BamB
MHGEALTMNHRLLIGLILFPLLMGADWLRFRGPNGSGVVEAGKIPTQWTEKDIAWKAKLPGTGYSSPIVVKDRVIATASNDKDGSRHIVAVSLENGKTLWTRTIPGKSYHLHKKNSIATATPASDGERIFSTWGTPDECLVLAHDLDGEQLWKVNIGPYASQHGFGMSPFVYDGAVIVHYQPDGDGSILALDVKTGKEIWKLPRKGKNATYSTGCIRRNSSNQDELIFTNWQHGITAVDPKTGKVNWEVNVFDAKKSMRAIVSPVLAGDLVIGTSGMFGGQKYVVAVQVGEKPKELWRLERGALPQMATPIVLKDHLYIVTEEGHAQCIELKTGKSCWSERVGSAAFNSSPIALGDLLYCTAANGDVFVIKARTDMLEVVGKSSLGESTQATPAVAEDCLIFRTETEIIAIRKK